MTRKTKTILQISFVIILMILLSIAAYYLGSRFARGFLTAGMGITLVQWQSHFARLVAAMGGVSCLALLTWYSLARFFLRLDNAQSVDKRSIWLVIGAAEIAFCLSLPYIFSTADKSLKLGISIPILFLGLFAIIGFWFGSILVTPSPYKYTPIGSSIFRRSRKH